MLISNNSYFYEFHLEFSRRKKLSDIPTFDSFWKGFYLIFNGIYTIMLMILILLNIKVFPNIFLILFSFEYLKEIIYTYNEYLYIIIPFIQIKKLALKRVFI